MKTVFITGANRGLGLEFTKQYLQMGNKVIACARNPDISIELIKLSEGNQNLRILPMELSNEDSINAAVAKVDEPVDLLINNAGITQDNLAIRMSLDEWQKVININLTSTFLMSKFAIKKMLKNKSGKIVNITSVVGHTGNLGQANYTASKAAIVAMSKSLAIEYAKKNININCISPGFIKTAMTDNIDEKFREVIVSKIPSARLGEPDDIANAVLFLSSDQSDYINGETIHVNGGMYMA